MAIDRLLDGPRPEALTDHADFADNMWGPFHDRIHQYLLRLTGSTDLAEEFTQDVFMRAYEKAGTVREGLQIGPWLYKIATNRAKDHFRRTQVVQFTALDPLALPTYTGYSKFEQPESFTALREEQREVQAAYAKLLPRQQRVLAEYEVEGLSCDEIGEHLGISRGAVKSLLFRARQALKHELKNSKPLEPASILAQPEPRVRKVKRKLVTVAVPALAVEAKEETPLLIRGFERLSDALRVDLFQLANTNHQLRIQAASNLGDLMVNETQVVAQARTLRAVDYFTGQLQQLAGSGVPMPDIGILLPKRL